MTDDPAAKSATASANWTAGASRLRPATPPPPFAGGAATHGPADEPFPWASVTKILTSMAVWVAVEEGTVGWDDPAGPPGATLATSWLTHRVSPPTPRRSGRLAGTRRIYSNAGIEAAARHLSGRAGMAFGDYLAEAVLSPLGLTATVLKGSPASGASGPLRDLLKVGAELLDPSLFSAQTLELVTTPAFPVWPGSCPDSASRPTTPGAWASRSGPPRPRTGLAPKLAPHVRPLRPIRRFPVGGPGEARACLASVSSRPFGPWAPDAWPALADAVLAASL